MLWTFVRAAGAVVGLAIAVIGVLVVGPPEVVLVATLSVVVGLGEKELHATARPGRRLMRPVVAATATACVLTVLTGLLVILGSAAATVLPVPLAIGGAWVWRHRQADAVPPLVSAPWPVTATAPATVADLRLAWDLSSTLLRDLPPGSTRWQLAEERRRLLDQLEHHDPGGFDRWMLAAVRVDDEPPEQT